MGPKSKAAVLKVLGALTQEARDQGALLTGISTKLDKLLEMATSNEATVKENTRMVGETVASHTKANAQIIELQRKVRHLEQHDGAAE